jgi:hypothetical protein
MNNHKIHIYYYAFYAVPPGPGQYDTTVPGYVHISSIMKLLNIEY